MFKLLKIKVSEYKLLKTDFEIDLTSKARVFNEDLENEVHKLDNSLFSFNTISFVGSNSSGKSTILSLIYKVCSFLSLGRWEYYKNEFNKEFINLKIDFYLDGYLYSYQVRLNKPEYINPNSVNFLKINDERLFKSKYKSKKSIEEFDSKKIDISNELNSLNDTSSITNIIGNSVKVDFFNTNNISNINEIMVRNSFFEALSNSNNVLVSSIIKLLDESIEYIELKDNDTIKFKRFNEKEEIMNKLELINILSSGTFRGVELYIRASNALKNGSILIVDEIESSFQKNLVSNLLFLFNDANININHATLIFSTHYTEILDYLKRRDSIFITHKENGRIDIKNLYSDYNIRCELSKSKLFDNNAFNTSINYDELKNVRRNLINELHSSND